MIPVLLTILKVIGVALLVLIGLIIFVVLLVLFGCPIYLPRMYIYHILLVVLVDLLLLAFY